MSEPSGNEVLLRNVVVEVSVELGRSRMGLEDLARRLSHGALIHMGKDAGERVDIFVNGRLVGRGEAVAVGQRHGVRITQILPRGTDPLRGKGRSILSILGMKYPSSPSSPSSPSPHGASTDADDAGDTDAPPVPAPAFHFDDAILLESADDSGSVAGSPGEPLESAPSWLAAETPLPPPELEGAALVSWAWQNASVVEGQSPSFERDPVADAARFRAEFERHAGLAPEHLRWLSDDLFCVAGPIGEPAEYLCFVRAHAVSGDSPLLNHLFDRLSFLGNPRLLVEPCRVSSAAFDEVDGDVYALFPEQFTKGRVD